MLSNFKSYIQKHHLIIGTAPVLLAISGGIDSMVMASLFLEAGIPFVMAHCNFHLRGEESDGDEAFVRTWAEEHHVNLTIAQFDTIDYAKRHGVSIEMAARDLRYHWFDTLCNKHNYQSVAVAHHKNDVAETYLINTIRGTGIAGLHGLYPKRNKVIRPLLFALRDGIEGYAKEHGIESRYDRSNSSTDYVRNKIRLEVIPLLSEINPSITETLVSNSKRMRDIEMIFNQKIEEERAKVTSIRNEYIIISIDKLSKLVPIATYLFEFIRPYNFQSEVIHGILESLGKESGKLFYSSTHQLIKDREELIISPILTEDLTEYSISPKGISDPIHLSLNKISRSSEFRFSTDPLIASLDYDKLVFPLTLRKWREGDAFYPLGMRQKQKLSDFFINLKLSIIAKQEIWILLSKDEIVWVVGLRMDNRFKITDTTKEILVVKMY